MLSLSAENLEKPSMKNGSCSTSGVRAKWKPRKLSAVRDFPVGFGRDCLPVHLSLLEAVVPVICTDSKVESSVPGAAIEAIDNGVGEMLMENGEVVGVLNAAVDDDGTEKNGVGLAGETEEVEDSGKKEMLEREAWCLMKEELHCVGVDSRVFSNGEVVYGVKSLATGQELNSGRNSHQAKFPKRRVSANRDFPPFCGWNAPAPSEAENLQIAGNAFLAVGCGEMSAQDVGDRSVKKNQSSQNKSSGVMDKGGAGSLNMIEDMVTGGEGATQDVRDGYVKKNQLSENMSSVALDKGVCSINVVLPPFGPKNSNNARNRVRETRQLFQAACRKLLHGEEAKLRPGEEMKSQKQKSIKRIDCVAASYVKRERKSVNCDEKILGEVPGVEVGDEFQYRAELAIVGIHGPYQAGIDYIQHKGIIVATSIVASGGYDDELGNSDVLIYSGQGGNIGSQDKHKPAEDQKLLRGNLALKNSISAKTPVRVIRGSKEIKAAESSKAKAKIVMSYVYDGLYTVVDYKKVPGPRDGKLVFKFELRRIPGQPELSWKEVNKINKQKIREGLCVTDISGGREFVPICAVNTKDSEKPPTFNYITQMKYPNQYNPAPLKGCQCTDGCLNFEKCSCAFNNGGEVPVIPYNHNGAIVEPRTFVYECGPHCACPPSCYNRVTQHGIKIPLEIFKTGSKGWGVRSLKFIPSGTFICEYTGELLEDTEAEKRIEFDEYLFDISEDEKASYTTNARFCIDAMKYGNIGRFINHSCSPNLYAQNVLYDHGDKRMPHIMLFAVENIPPLQELTHHYNYVVDTVLDSHGNVKKKLCLCGSNECNGRLY